MCALQWYLSRLYSESINDITDPESPTEVSWFKWGVLVSDEIDTDGNGNIVSGPFAGQYQCERHALSHLMLSSCHSEAH